MTGDARRVPAAVLSADEGWARALRSPRVVVGLAIFAAIVLAAGAAPLLGSIDPLALDTQARNLPPGTPYEMRLADGSAVERVAWFGTDSLGRDVYSRVLYGGRVSLLVGLTAALASGLIGLVVGLAAGYIRAVDLVVMRIMDGLMAIPGVLLAIGLVSVWRTGIATVVVAILVPEIPRAVRLVRSVTLRVRAEPYVEAAIGLGTPTALVLLRHVAPSALAPLIVQCTFACATAILIEAALSFLAVGVSVETPSWGNVMSEGRQWFRLHPHVILAPGAFIALAVLAVNTLGDGLRDALDTSEARA